MPRITKATRTSLPIQSNSYDFNKEFRDYTTGNLYDKQDNLIIWTDYCDPELASDVTNYDIIGVNQSNNQDVTNLKLYSKSGTGLKTKRRSQPYNSVFCGDKCLFALGSSRSNAPGDGSVYSSGYFYYINDEDNLSFVNESEDLGFTISFWVRSVRKITIAGNEYFFNFFSLNNGGTDGTGDPIPTFFNKKDEYRLTIDDNGRLRLTLYDDTNNATIYNETIEDVFTDDEWNNIVVTYDGSGISEGILIYKNGSNVVGESRTGGTGTYSNMSNTNNKFYFGAADPSITTSNMPSMVMGTGALSKPMVIIGEVAIWNAQLNENNIKSIYNASLTCQATDTARESGYLNINPRIRLRELDCMTGSYPTIKRTGDRDFKGKYAVNFNDLSVLKFGERIVDEFSNIGDREISSRNIDKSNWEYSYGMEIRRESSAGNNGATFSDGVLVFTGPISRFLKTKRRVRNAIIEYELVQGPHNQATDILGRGLKLEGGTINEKLKVQFTTDPAGLTGWTDLKTHTPTLNLNLFYDYSQQQQNRKRKRIRIHFRDIPAGDSEYYIRFVQENFDSTWKAVWGIGRIEIISMNQDVRYPLLVNHDINSGKIAKINAISTPHTRSDLTAVGRTLSGVSDQFIHFTPGENLSPFSEHYAIESLDNENMFYAIGSDPETGVLDMSSRLADKTKIKITLGTDNTNEEIGHTDRSGYDDPLSEQPLDGLIPVYAYGSNIGRPIYNFSNSFIKLYGGNSQTWGTGLKTPNYSYIGAGGFEEFVKKDVRLGFGTIDNVGFREDQIASELPDIKEQFGKDALSNYVRPIKTFGFPFSDKFEQNETECIKASDYIDKPFVIEKIVVDFKAAFEFAADGDLGERAYSTYTTYEDSGGNPGARSALGPRFIIPTFFILNQFKSYHSASLTLKNQEWNEIAGETRTIFNKINYRSENDLTREMISYGQMTLFASSSNNYGLDVEKLLEEGLGRDLNVDVLRRTGQSGINIEETSINHFTSSFRLEFPCRVSGKTDYNQKIIFLTGSETSSNPIDNRLNAYFTSDPTGGRNISNLEKGNRGLINNYSSRKSGEPFKTFGLYNTIEPFDVETTNSEQMNLYSPYILMPGDQLIFGWHYPVNVSYGFRCTGNSDQKRNIMRLLGKSEVYFYGSFLSDKKETHEYTNQPLTSNAIHEYIGAEKVVDQYQIETRRELSGSYIDDWIYSNKNGERWTHAAFSLPDIYIFSDASKKRIERIGKPKISISSYSILEYDILENWHAGIANSVQRQAAIIKAKNIMTNLGERDQIQRFVRLKNEDNFYLDSIRAKGNYYNDSTYGTFQSFYKANETTGFVSSDPDDKIDEDGFLRKLISPKYYFNYRHFGHAFDFYDQGKDSKMWKYKGPVAGAVSPEDAQRVDEYDISDSNTPPTVVKWVTSSIVDDVRIKTYRLSSYSDLYSGVSDSELKPYNSDIYSTSSIPYLDEKTVIFTD